MAGTVKKLQFSEGTDVGAPTDLSLATSTTTISEYADDTAYTTANGAASAGDVYINSTLKVLRYYTGSAWRNAVPAMDPTDATKTFLIDISGNTTGVSATLSFSATGNRVYSFPDVAITVAGRANSETLSNKTLASPLISGGSIDTTGAGALAIGASVGANNMTLGGAASTVVIAGNLQVDGTTTTVNSTTLEVDDANIEVNKGGNDASAEGAGLTVDRTGTSGSFIYKDASASKFACGPAGSELDIVDVSSLQTLTNKTIGVSQLSGQVSIPNGGTGQSTANAALNALLPSQATHNGKALRTDGSNTSWASIATLPISAADVTGRTDGAAPSAGYIGQVLTSGVQTGISLVTGSYTTVASVSLTAGSWAIYANAYVAAATSMNRFIGGIATATNSNTGHTDGENTFEMDSSSQNTNFATSVGPYIVNISSTTTYYLTAKTGGAGSTGKGTILGVRIA